VLRGVWKVLRRHGLNTRAKRLGLIAGYAAPYEPPRDPGPEQHIDVDRPIYSGTAQRSRIHTQLVSKLS
jgi:hypothetical protein